jgi:hypothetical protein
MLVLRMKHAMLSCSQNQGSTFKLNKRNRGFNIISGASRKMFDIFYRALLNGQNADYPKPKVFKLARDQLFPEHQSVFEWIYDKKNSGTWITWTDVVDTAQTQLARTVKVSEICGVDDWCCYRREYLLH